MNLLLLVEASLRILLGLRFLTSGVTNARGWPGAARLAAIVFPFGAYYFALFALILQIAGGVGMVLGFQTPLAALCLFVFLLPTFKIHHQRLQTIPGRARTVADAITSEAAKGDFRVLQRYATEHHEHAWQNNLIFLAACFYFAVRGASAFAIDPWLGSWLIRLF